MKATVADGRRSILIVDDEFGLAEMLRELLTELDYDIEVAINGRAALDVLNARRIDLVITDLMMPVMDGSELARAMRGEPRFQHIPILLMTSLPTAAPRDAALYDEVLRKPFMPDALLASVSRYLNHQ